MKERIKITVCAITVCIAVTMSAVTVNSLLGNGSADAPSDAKSGADSYILMAYGGRIAVFSASDPGIPITVTGISVSSLRESDRQLIEEGIALETQAQVAQLLEDLGS